jgi:hypothetical protein
MRYFRGKINFAINDQLKIRKKTEPGKPKKRRCIKLVDAPSKTTYLN